MDKIGEDLDGLHLGEFEKRRPNFFSNLSQLISKYHLHSGKIILSSYVALILQMKDSSLPIWRLELITDKIKQNYLK